MTAKAIKETPLMKQYFAIKGRYPGALLLFRVGDFYETFGEDAIKASKILDITLTKRANGAASHVELAGFPHHALDTYLPKLVRAGERVAICDQLEDPKSVKGIVKRGVTELVTPGLAMNDQVLEAGRNNFLVAMHASDGLWGLAFLDLSTGEFLVTQAPETEAAKLVHDFQPKEIIGQRGQELPITGQVMKQGLDEWVFQADFGYQKLIHHFKTTSLKGFGIDDMKPAIIAAGAILHYLEETEHRQVGHITSISRLDQDKHVWLDRFTVRNLELLQPAQHDGQSLDTVLNHCLTPMGQRMLRKWVVWPLKDVATINHRLDVVEALGASELKESLRDILHAIGDLERLLTKVATGRINPRELNALRNSLQHVAPIRERLENSSLVILEEKAARLDACQALTHRIAEQLREDAPMQLVQGHVICEGVDAQLDEYRSLSYSGKDHLARIVQHEIGRTGISSLKISYNKVFGYYLEVTNVHKDKVPSDWIRKQTLVNAERYITEELKTYEEKILSAESQIQAIEQRIFNELVAFAATFIPQIQATATAIAELDVLVNFRHVADLYRYARPTVTDETSLTIKEGRHPVIERNLPVGEPYIPNDIFLDTESQQIMVITGPNMAGKSALLRQTALITLMAQMGSFVPATYARIGVVDKVFTRVGASDNLTRGESTFMVEMTETASILHNLSNRSLVLMDEIGRGTSTYDGISIAWSIVEYLHNHPKGRAKTLFATHYHELNELAEKLPRVKNFNVAVRELENKVVFLRKLVEGGTEHSFGIHVAQMAGIPNEVVLRAHTILKQLETDKVRTGGKEKMANIPEPQQLNLFQSDPRLERILNLLKDLDINSTSPVEALLKLNELMGVVKK
jgi:DNA mismatch repair protein MutS